MAISAGLAVIILALALWFAVTAKSQGSDRIRGGFNFDQFKIQELARRGVRNRQKNPFLRLLNFLAWSVPRRDDHGSISNGA